MTRERPTVSRWFWRILWIAAVSLVLTAIVFELYLRFSGFMRAQPANYPCVTSDPVLNHVFLPSCSSVAKGADLKTDGDAFYQVNRLGFRGPEPSPWSELKSKGRGRLLVIGDSYVEGFGLSENETLPARLQEELNGGAKKNWEVWNGGTLGFCPTLYTAYFDRFFIHHRPNFVLLNLDFSDLNDNSYYLEIADYDALGMPVAFPPRDSFPAFALPLVYSNRSALLRFLHQEWNQWKAIERRAASVHRMNSLIEGEPLIPLEELNKLGVSHCRKSYEWMARSILRLKNRAEIVGARFGIHMYPPGASVKKYENLPQGMSFVRSWDQRTRKDYSWNCESTPAFAKAMEEFARRNGIFFHSSFPVVMAHPEKESLYFSRDAHWNASGVRVVAPELAKAISRWVSEGRQ